MAENIERETIRAVARRLLPWVFLLYLLSLIDRVNLGFAALTMNKELGLTPYTYSIGVAAFFIGYIPMEVPSNLILERFGARLWIGRIAITWGLIASAMALVVGWLKTTTGSFSGGLYYVAAVTVVAALIFSALRGVTRVREAPAPAAGE